jgi:hypothetical protein
MASNTKPTAHKGTTEGFRSLDDVYFRIQELELEGASKFVSASKDKHFGVVDLGIIYTGLLQFHS